MKAPLFRALSVTLVLSIALAGCTGPKEAATAPALPETGTADPVAPQSVTGSTGSVGGTIKNSAPTYESLAPDATTGENRGGFVVVFTATVKDRNTEAQIQNVSFSAVGPALLGANHVVTSDEKNATSEPAEFGADGFKVWTGTRNDGVLNVKYRQAFPAFTPAGAYAVRGFVTDAPGLVAASAPVAITLSAFSDITIDPTPVSLAGAALPGSNWGEWDAEAGATNVEATNFIKLVNTGDVATSRVVIDLASQFIGSADSGFAISAANNLQFAWFEDTTPATTSPSEGTFSWLPANSESSVTVDFTGKGNVIYVKYRIVQLPEILPPQSYGISFTVTELA